MDGALVESLPAIEPADVSDLVRQLGRELLGLRQEVHELRRENAELRQQAGYWKAQHARAVQRAERLEAEVQQLRAENRKLQDQLFGRKSETASSKDRSNRLEGEEEPAPATPPRRGQRPDRPGPTRRDYSHLPVVEELRELPDPAARLPAVRRGPCAQRHRGFRTDRDRGPGLSPKDPTAALSTHMLLLARSPNRHRGARAQADPQGRVGRVGLGGDPARQVRQLPAHRAVARPLAIARSGPGGGHGDGRPATPGAAVSAALRRAC